ncbi:MAG: TIGR03013 family PEP-CTERM/XrtA system glycosyltransferase [Rhodospirillales bacterium]|nr:TIGR03013 family PEP-CTERM/XrtA system glycosyltransferase [Rhodospirillales bacterium]
MLLALGDTLLLYVSLLIATSLPFVQTPTPGAQSDLRLIASIVIVSFLVLASLGLYNRAVFYHSREINSRMIVALPLVIVACGLFIYVYSFYGQPISRYLYIVILSGIAVFFLLTFFLRELVRNVFNMDRFKRRVLVLGAEPLATKVDEIARDPARGHFLVVGYLGLGDEESTSNLHPKLPSEMLTQRHALADFVRKNRVEEIVVVSRERRRSVGKLGPGLPIWDLLECKLEGAQITTYADFWEREARQVDLDELQPSWLIFSDGFRVNSFTNYRTRFFDLLVSICFLVVILPVFLLTALSIKLTSPGPVFYRQERVGRGGKPFQLLKFRSMCVDAEKDGVPVWAKENDERITPIGHFIRKTRIDEIPQVINVLKGEMSFVGPRPERPYFVESLQKKIPYYIERHRVRPGITGWAQTSCPYGASEEDAKLKLSYDLYYIKNSSLFLDALILLQTVRVVLWNYGAR